MGIYIFIFIIILYLISLSYLFLISIKETERLIDYFNSKIEIFKNAYLTYKDSVMLENIHKITTNKVKILLIKTKKIKKFKEEYSNIKEIISSLKENYIKKEMEANKEYFNTIFNYPLDEEQRISVVVDDNNNLIIAGAGSGKTSTMVAKVKYLTEKKNIPENEIIVISFTKNAVSNFEERLKLDNVFCTTFHKLGLQIIKESNNKKPDIADDYLLNRIIIDYLNNKIKNDPKKIKKLVTFFGYYIHMPFTIEFKSLGEKYNYEKGFDLETLKYKMCYLDEELLKIKNNNQDKYEELITLKREKTKSYEELLIANYLFLNGIEYEYEPSYKYGVATLEHRQYHPDFYLPEYDIYIEHFGIDENGRNTMFTEIEERKYLDGIKWKREIHKKYNTKLEETYSFYYKNNILFEKLNEIITRNHIKTKQVDYNKIYNYIISERNKQIYASFIELITKFIRMFKGNNYEFSKFSYFQEIANNKNNLMEKNRDNILLEIIQEIYLEYQEELKRRNQIDFDDMINIATNIVNNNANYKEKISYILIDEFQDTSLSRYSLLKAIQDKTDAKIIAVGDDWQSIFHFSGSNLDLFINFQKYFAHPEILYINNTHRNSQELINIAGDFILKNPNQIKKNLQSTKRLSKPVHLFYYTKDVVKATNHAIDELISIGCKEILILGRNNYELSLYNNGNIDNIKKMQYPYKMHFNKNANIYFSTVHRAKGLEYDGVIVCNLRNYLTGFPNKMTDDPILNYVKEEKQFLYEEERRLFYVALTRTKTKCCLLVPSEPSIFINELADNKDMIDITICEKDVNLYSPSCPICQKGKLKLQRNSKDGSYFVGCTNYPRCTFHYKSLDIIKNPIECPRCHSYLVKRNGCYGPFYGCINYPLCTQTIDIDNNINK